MEATDGKHKVQAFQQLSIWAPYRQIHHLTATMLKKDPHIYTINVSVPPWLAGTYHLSQGLQNTKCTYRWNYLHNPPAGHIHS